MPFDLLLLLREERKKIAQCPMCKQRWRIAVRDGHGTIYVGKPTMRCRCGTDHDTGFLEWAELSREQRKGYFFSSAEIGIVALFTAIPGIFGYGLDRWHGVLVGAGWGLVVGLTFAALLWAIKIVIVVRSVRRVPVTSEVVEASGFLPWRW